MHKVKKETIIAILEQLLPVILAAVCILIMAVNTYQAILPVPLQLNFEGAYSFDGGESWETLTPNSDLSTDRGDLLLRGHFNYDLPEGAALYLYRDHFGVISKLNGEQNFISVQSEIITMGDDGMKYFADVCGREWLIILLENGLRTTDTVEIHLQKMHNYIDADAYRNFLNSCFTGPTDTSILQAYLQPHVSHWIVIGYLLVIMAVLMLGGALVAATIQTGMVPTLCKTGFLLLFAGGYMILDTVTLSFWNDALAVNTYGRQICMMLAVYWLDLIVRDLMTGRRKMIAKAIAAISLALNVALILPSFLGAWAIYDTVSVWAIGQSVFALVLLAVAVWEFISGTRKISINVCSCVLLQVTLLLDIAGIRSSMYSRGTCTKTIITIVFVVYVFRALKRVLIDYQGARRAKKLEQELEKEQEASRVAIMLSQMRPHFIHNILNVIYYLCGKNPAAAQAAISKFSDYLRNNLESLSQGELITFRKELNHIYTYLELEQIRFAEELTVVFDIEEDSFLLPVLSIEPLVENAVKHGIAHKRGGGVVTISSRQLEHAYQITVTDTGVGFDVDRYMEDGKVHIGLANVRQRLRSSLDATVDISSEPGKGTTVTVTIPKERVSR
jgi:sensor histidine kinase YesM